MQSNRYARFGELHPLAPIFEVEMGAAAAAVVVSQITNVVEKFCFIYSFHLHFAHKSNCIRRMQYEMLNRVHQREQPSTTKEEEEDEQNEQVCWLCVVKCKFVNKNPNGNFLAGNIRMNAKHAKHI